MLRLCCVHVNYDVFVCALFSQLLKHLPLALRLPISLPMRLPNLPPLVALPLAHLLLQPQMARKRQLHQPLVWAQLVRRQQLHQPLVVWVRLLRQLVVRQHWI
jgi:hypothetical protein